MKYIIYLQTPPTLRDPADFKFVGGENYNCMAMVFTHFIFIETELNIKNTRFKVCDTINANLLTITFAHILATLIS